MKRFLVKQAMLGAALVVLGCDGTRPATPTVLQSEQQRITAPQVPPADLEALVRGNSNFAVDLYHQLRGTPGNLFYSPYSISLALAMTYGGARGNTETQMAAALHFTLPQDRLHLAFDALDLALASRGQGALASDGKAFRLKIANSVWGQTGYNFLSSYLDLLALNYGAGLRLLDFRTALEPARLAINQWVSDATEQKIPELLKQGTITPDARLVLTNAVYFNAAWKFPFEHEAAGQFTRLDGSQVSATLMTEEAGFGYATGQGYKAVELPYDGDQLSMIVVLPDQGSFTQFESQLTRQALEAIIASLEAGDTELKLPKFQYRSDVPLRSRLEALGMMEAFSDGADLSGIDGTHELSISNVVHQGFVAVNEKGTEAAAATGVVVGVTSFPQRMVIVDHPFIFVIRDRETGTLLFLGRVVDPT